MDDLQGTERAYLRADAAGSAVLLNGKISIDQFESSVRADRYATSARSTNIPMYFEH
jgi:hypothetical protein